VASNKSEIKGHFLLPAFQNISSVGWLSSLDARLPLLRKLST